MWLSLCCALPNVRSVVKSKYPHTIHEQHQYSRLDKLHGHIPHLNAAAKLPWWQYGRLRDGSGPVAKTSLLYQALLPDSFIDFLSPLHLLFLLWPWRHRCMYCPFTSSRSSSLSFTSHMIPSVVVSLCYCCHLSCCLSICYLLLSLSSQQLILN